MPTVRPRHLLTETDELAQAIDTAAALYPGESRADVLRRLVQLGAETIAEQQGRHRDTVRNCAGRFPGLYLAGHLDDLREDWPE